MITKNKSGNSSFQTEENEKKQVTSAKKNKKSSKKKKIIITVACIVFVLVAVLFWLNVRKPKTDIPVTVTEVKAEKRDITSSITGSSVVNPKDQYSISSLVSGDVLFANFEMGDIVKKGEVLYRIDSSDAENSIESAKLAVQRSTNNYNNALKDQKDLTIVSGVSGTVKKLYFKAGDSIGNGAAVADIIDDTALLLTIPFNEADASSLYVGLSATVSISGTFDTLPGIVTEVKGSGYAKDGNMMVRDVVIRVENPGTLMITDSAVATVGDIACNDIGTFKYLTEKTITSKTSGDVSTLYVSEGDRINAGDVIAVLNSEAINESIENSALSLEESKLSRKNAEKRLEDYTITAPISGTVIEKNVKAGDKLDNTNMSSAMAIIYDMSSLECELSVDELDIKNVKEGQEAVITSDALKGKTYHGEVQRISVNGTTSNGVTTYPVTIVINDFDDDLLPGMNIDVEIIISQAKDVLTIPFSAVKRGNIVYVKGEKKDKNDEAPEGYKSVEIKTGVYDEEYIEVKSGLKEGDMVYNPQVKFPAANRTVMPGGMPGGMGGGMSGGGNMRNGTGGVRPGGMSGGMR